MPEQDATAAVARLLTGDGDYDELSPAEQATARGQWSERMLRALAELDFAREFTRAGTSYAELDEHGRAVRREPRPRA